MAESDTRRPNVLVLAVLGIVVLALVAVVIGIASGGDDDDDTASTAGETREVEVTGEDLPKLDDPADDPAVGLSAPTVAGENLDGEQVAIPTEGPTVVIFLAHWCPHCQREVPFLLSYFDEQGMPDGVDVIGVATNIDPAAPNYPPSAWFDREGWTIPTLFDADDDAAARAYGLSAYPYFVAIDADGNVAARASGELEAPALEALFDAARGG